MENYETGNLIDDAARILAGPLLRRQALKALTQILLGSFFAAFGVRRAQSQAANDTNSGTCRPACKDNDKCCPGTDGKKAFCVDASQTCCGNTGCSRGQTCCRGTNGQRFCSSNDGTCCGNSSCSDKQQCCRTSSQPFCTTDPTCCGKSSCSRNETCCANTVCCTASQTCKSGRCQSSRV
jgi:hypothetical protein